MDPIELLYRKMNMERMKVSEYANELKKHTDPEVIQAYSTLKTVHTSTLNGVNLDLAKFLQIRLSTINPPTE
jgi:hypothetical protein